MIGTTTDLGVSKIGAVEVLVVAIDIMTLVPTDRASASPAANTNSLASRAIDPILARLGASA